MLEWEDVPSGYAHVPIHLKVYSDSPEKSMLKAVAGSVGWKVLDSDAIFPHTRGEGRKEAKVRDKGTFTGLFQLYKAPESTSTIYARRFHASRSQICKRPQNLQPNRADSASMQDTEPPSEELALAFTARDQALLPNQGAHSRWSGEVRRHAPQISGLSELSKPWVYNKGGKHDTI